MDLISLAPSCSRHSESKMQEQQSCLTSTSGPAIKISTTFLATVRYFFVVLLFIGKCYRHLELYNNLLRENLTRRLQLLLIFFLNWF